jgi:hypothetical protein
MAYIIPIQTALTIRYPARAAGPKRSEESQISHPRPGGFFLVGTDRASLFAEAIEDTNNLFVPVISIYEVIK